MEPRRALTGVCAAILVVLLASLFTGCLQEKQANASGDEPTPPAPPGDDYGVQATATLGPSNPNGSATAAPSSSGGGDQPPALPN